MDALTLRGEEHTHDTLLLATVTMEGIDFEVFDGVKGKVKITHLSLSADIPNNIIIWKISKRSSSL